MGELGVLVHLLADPAVQQHEHVAAAFLELQHDTADTVGVVVAEVAGED